MRARFNQALTLLALLLMAAPAGAQRRDGGVPAGLELRLPWAVRFGDVTVPAGFYRVAAHEDGLSLASPSTMVVLATVPVEKTTVEEVVTPATIERRERGTEVLLVVRNRQEVLTARGEKTVVLPPDPSLVELAGKKEALVAAGEPQEQTEEALVDAALKRYLPSLRGCADRAQRGRWRTDDPRFVKCVCPLVEKWRLPKVKRLLRLHRPIAKGKSGLSIVVSPDGRAYGCRVWVGAAPPDPPPEPSQDSGAPVPGGASTDGR